ncbi:ferredoxin NADP+ reductase (fragment) [Bartonella tribocorum CIP 105476]|uniref:Ferredoxin NADP+ reductase n=1 Tax=Bartonella tribocorum (strain DSM 28219 / CCUG 45778 / CIP 105476 / IBS 506) TaxID=382640 RepID=A9IWU2_BART1
MTYAKDLVCSLQQDPLIGTYAQQLKFYPMTTRAPPRAYGAYYDCYGEWVMICGSMAGVKRLHKDV